MKLIAPALLAATLAGAASSASAQSDFYRRLTPPNVAQGGVAGAVLIAGREYQGSDESRVRLLPSIDYQWSNGFFAGVINGVGYNASSEPGLAYGVRLTAYSTPSRTPFRSDGGQPSAVIADSVPR